MQEREFIWPKQNKNNESRNVQKTEKEPVKMYFKTGLFIFYHVYPRIKIGVISNTNHWDPQCIGRSTLNIVLF